MKEHIQKVYDIIQGSTGTYRVFQQQLRDEIQKVQRDPKFSEHGREYLIKELKKDKEQELIDLAKMMKKGIREELASAKMKAEKIINAPMKKPNDATIERFRKQLGELKTTIALTPNPARAKQALMEFTGGIEDPYLAEMVREDFGNLIVPIVSGMGGQERGRAQLELQEVFRKLKDDYKSEEYRQAEEILQSAEALEKSDMFDSLVVQVVRTDLGSLAALSINNPDNYDEKKAYQESLEKAKQA
jgi:predicted HD phosphohydrolase